MKEQLKNMAIKILACHLFKNMMVYHYLLRVWLFRAPELEKGIYTYHADIAILREQAVLLSSLTCSN